MRQGFACLLSSHKKCLLQAEGGDWKPELLFMVPREHEEIQRLEGRYKK